MRIVLQRVSEARVQVGDETVGEIGKGFLLLVGVGQGDTPADSEWLARKIAGLRVFPDEEGKMNLTLADVGGSCLVVSQFTLYGSCKKGFRPGFSKAAPAEEGRAGYLRFVHDLRAQDVEVETGKFQEDMQVHLINDGPVTLVLEKGGPEL